MIESVKNVLYQHASQVHQIVQLVCAGKISVGPTNWRSPTFSFEFVLMPRPYPSATTYAHPQHDMCPPMPTHAIQIAHVFKNCVTCITCLHQVLVGLDK